MLDSSSTRLQLRLSHYSRRLWWRFPLNSSYSSSCFTCSWYTLQPSLHYPWPLFSPWSISMDLRRSVLREAVLVCDGIQTGTPRLWHFAGAPNGDSLLSLPLGLWLCTVLSCFFVSIKNQLFRHDVLERLYLGLWNDDFRLEKFSNSFYDSRQPWSGAGLGSMNVRPSRRLCWAGPTVWNTLKAICWLLIWCSWGSWLMTQHLHQSQLQLQLFFRCMIVEATCCLTIQGC